MLYEYQQCQRKATWKYQVCTRLIPPTVLLIIFHTKFFLGFFNGLSSDTYICVR